MNSNGDTTAQHDPADEDFEEVLDEIAELIFRGDSIDGRTLKLHFPQHSDRIESLLPALRSMVSLGIAGDGGISKRHKRLSPIDTSVAGDSISLGGVDADTSLRLRTPTEDKQIGDFHILRKIGSGGMGVVYEAHQISMGRRVALKVLPLAALAQERGVQRFHNEVRAVAALDHPNIVSVYSVGEERGVHYFAMRLIHGQTMAAVIRALATTRASGAVLRSDDIASAAAPMAPELPTDSSIVSDTQPIDRSLGSGHHHLEEQRPNYFQSLAKLGLQAASAIQHAHDHGILHRDIKPGNLMIDSQGHVFVTDFGLARFEADAAATGPENVIGTLRYMSPEQALGKGVVDHRCDIYSLGVTLYELFTLRPPFLGGDRKELIRKIAFEEPPRPRAINRDIPAELQNIVLKAIEKNPAERYESASELADDLQAYLDFRPIKAKAPTVTQLAAKWGHRHRSLVRAVSATLLLAGLVAGTMLWREREQTQEALNFAQTQQKVAERRRNEAEQERATSRELLYGSDMKLASEAFHKGDVPLIWSLLERHRPGAGHADLRDFAWHYLHRRVTAPREWRTESGVSVNGSAISPSGQLLALGLENCQVRILDVGTGEILRKYVASDAVNSVSWGGDDQSLAASSADGHVSVWKWTDGITDSPVKPTPSQSVEQDGPETLVSVGRVDLQQPQLSFAAHKRDSTAILWVEEHGCIISGGDDGKISVWDSSTGNEVRVLDGHRARIEEFAISSDRTRFASASRDGTARLWDVATGEPLDSWNSPSGRRFQSVDFSKDGTYLAAGDSSGSLLLVNLRTERETVLQHLDWIESVRFVGPALVATGDRGGSIHIWNVTQSAGENQRVSAHARMMWSAQSDRVHTLATVPGTTELISSSRDGSVTKWSPDYASQQTEFTTARGFAVGYDETLLACHHDLLQYDLHDHSHRSSLLAQTDRWELIAAARESSWVVTANAAGRVTVTDWLLGSTVASWTVENPPYKIAISPNGKYVAIASQEMRKHVQLFDVDDPENPRLLPASRCHCITFHPDGNSIAISSKQDLLIFDLSAPSAPLQLKDHDGNIYDAAFSHDGQRIATVGCDRSLKLWDADLGVLLHSTEAHSSESTSVDFSSDDSTIATSGTDESIRLWRSSSLHPLLEIKAADAVEQVQFASHDRQLVARLRNDEVHLFDSSSEPYWPSSFSTRTAKGASLIGLGTAPYAVSHSVHDVSGDGQSVIGNYLTSQSDYRSFHWSKQQGLRPLLMPAGFQRSDAFHFSKYGILGRFSRTNEDVKVGRWKSSSESPTIDTFSYQHEFTSVTATASADDISALPKVVGYVRENDGQTSVPFKFDGQKAVTLPVPVGFEHSMVRDASQNGDVLTGMAWNGKRWARSQESRGMRVVQWRDGAVTQLKGFGKGPFNWYATCASSDGSVVIGFRWREGKPDASDQALAFRWEDGVVEMIGELPGGRPISIVEDASLDGGVIVGYSESSRRKTAFVWDRAHGMRSLKAVLMQYRVPTSQWRLETASAISPDGRHIAGMGIDAHGNSQPFIATLPPEAFADE